MSQPLPPLPDGFWDYLLSTESAGFNEDCACVSCQMVRDGFEHWHKLNAFLEWEAKQNKPA